MLTTSWLASSMKKRSFFHLCTTWFLQRSCVARLALPLLLCYSWNVSKSRNETEWNEKPSVTRILPIPSLAVCYYDEHALCPIASESGLKNNSLCPLRVNKQGKRRHSTEHHSGTRLSPIRHRMSRNSVRRMMISGDCGCLCHE